jgi:hypothetical protein
VNRDDRCWQVAFRRSENANIGDIRHTGGACAAIHVRRNGIEDRRNLVAAPLDALAAPVPVTICSEDYKWAGIVQRR